MTVSPRILIIDGPRENVDVLKAVFEPRGATVERIRGYRPLAADDSRNRPTLVVVDADSLEPVSPAVPENIAANEPHSNHPQAGRVVLGPLRAGLRRPTDRVLESPYEIAELLQSVESALYEQRAA